MELPRRRVQLLVNLGADSWDDAARALEDIAYRIHSEGEITDLCSGGCSSGYTAIGGENHEQTAEHYKKQIMEWRDEYRAKRDGNR